MSVMSDRTMKRGKWINVATVCRAARVLTRVVSARWPNCPNRLAEDCEKLIGGAEMAAASGGQIGTVDTALLENVTKLVGIFHLRAHGYESNIPELWDGNFDIRDSLPDSPQLQTAIRNWIDTACRCSRSALESKPDGAETESQAGVSWAISTLGELSARNALNELTSNFRDLDQALQALPFTKNATCSFTDGRWLIRRTTPWYKRWFT